MEKRNILQSFQNKNCCGCKACINVCPTHALYAGMDEFGFTVPKIDSQKCIECGKCIRVCPWKNEASLNKVTSVYAAMNRNHKNVLGSSSGGIFAALAEDVISMGGTAFGAAMDSDFKVRHRGVHKAEDLHLIMRSKYVQSDIGSTYNEAKELLKNGQWVLYAGTPCQVAGLKFFLGNSDQSKLLTIDIVCHGVPNQNFFSDYLKCTESKAGKKIEEYHFRAKKTLYNGMNWFFSVTFQGCAPKIKNWPEDSYNYYYMKGFTYRDSCYECKFAREERVSDITLCDFWSWDKYHSKDFEPSSPVSAILINSTKGADFINDISKTVKLVPARFEDVVRHNSCLAKPTPRPDGREELLNTWRQNGYSYVDEIFRKKYRKQILKYKVLGMVPERVISLIHKQ